MQNSTESVAGRLMKPERSFSALDRSIAAVIGKSMPGR